MATADEYSANRSVIWEYFTRVKTDETIYGIRKVESCKLKFKCPTGATSSLYVHLRSAHPKLGKECDSKKDEETKKRKHEEPQNKLKQACVDKMFADKTVWPSNNPNAVATTQAIARMIALDFLPYSVVEGEGFKAVIKLLEPRYRIPSRTTFSRSTVPTLYKKTKSDVMNRIKIDLNDGTAFSFCTDIWTSKAMDSFISFCLMYLTDNFIMKSIAIENKPFPGTNTADNISESLEKTIDDWELPRSVPTFGLRDNGANIKAAMSRSQSYSDLDCFAHTLQLAINDGIKEVDGMQAMLTKCKRIVGHYHYSCVAMGRLHAEQRRLKREERDLIMSVATRWNSDYYMVERLVDEKDAVSADIAVTGKVDNLTETEWKLATGFKTILHPFEQASRELCGATYPTMSMKIPAIKGLLSQLHHFIDDSANRRSGVVLARKLKISLNKRFESYELQLPDAMCTFVDPRYKGMYFSADQQQTVVFHLKQFATELSSLQTQIQSTDTPNAAASSSSSSAANECTVSTSKSQSTLWDNHDDMMSQATDNIPSLQSDESFDDELKYYLKDTPIGRGNCPLMFWRQNKQRLPLLAKLARSLLSIPATSVNSERLNSTSGNVVSIKRNNLLSEHVLELTFLHENLE